MYHELPVLHTLHFLQHHTPAVEEGVHTFIGHPEDEPKLREEWLHQLKVLQPVRAVIIRVTYVTLAAILCGLARLQEAGHVRIRPTQH